MLRWKLHLALISCLAGTLVALPARADEAEGVLLLRPDSLVGWEYGDGPIGGWKIDEGKLSGQAGATPLVSGFSMGEFRLDVKWSTADGGAVTVALSDVPKGKGLGVTLREGDGCGRVVEGEKTLAPGKPVAAAKDGKMHTATIERTGGKLAVAVDGKPVGQVDVKAGRRFGLGLAMASGKATLTELRLREPAGGPIFNGRDLKGWWCPGNLAAWKAENNELILHQRGGNYLRTEKAFGNFTLSLEYKIRARGNSGIGIRTPRNGWPSGDGMELQIEDRPAMNKHATMAIYGNVPPIARADKSEQWNRVVVKADGPMISAWINGQMVQHFNTLLHPELKHRNRQGWIGFQDHGAEIHIRNIRVLEAPAGCDPEAWQRPPAPLATTALLDRLMNSERLSVDAAIRSGVVVGGVVAEKREPAKEKPKAKPVKAEAKPKPAKAPQAGAKKEEKKAPESGPKAKPVKAEPKPKPAKAPEAKPKKEAKKPAKEEPKEVPHKRADKPVKKDCVLAELTGPGAVVRIARSNDQGRLAFYFDGQKKPRLECKARDLWKAVVPVGEDRNPVVTCLTYKKSLKIVLRDVEEAAYRIDYVTLPAGMAVESFVNQHSGFPRGWLSSVEYRLGQGRWGVIRQYDPAPRIVSEKKGIEPGKTEPLALFDGAGIVQWLQLNAFKSALDNNDLWLEVTIDGQSKPALAAPARYFFPGLAGQSNYNNFVLSSRGGMINRLAIPFGKGLTVSARNTGKKPIPNIGVTFSVLPIEEAEAAGRMRLRGIYQPAGKGGDQLANIKGPGRWVGMVYQRSDGPPSGIDSLVIDGRAAPGWKAADLDAFLGQSGDFRSCLSGRLGPLAWRYLLLAPVDFEKSLLLKGTVAKQGDRFILYYGRKK